jgi:ketosteroid isomerase-like protein
MSEENVELLQRLVEAVNADAVPPDLLTPDFEVRNATTAVTDATYHGHEGALQWRSDLFDVVQDACFEVDEILAAGADYLVVATRIVGRGRLSGAPVDLPWVSVFWFRDGMIARAEGYNRRREALQAVGLRDQR